MKIEVTDISRTFGRQTRAYAEYRIFSSLAAFGHLVREVVVSLTSGARNRSRSVVCSVRVDLGTEGPVTVTARGRHAYDAINRAADRLGPALRRSAIAEVPQ